MTPKLQHIADELKTITVFADLGEEDLAWLAERMEEKSLNTGEVYARVGDPLEHLSVLLEGEMQFDRPQEPGTPMFIARAPQVTGLLPFSRLTHYKGTARIVRSTRSLLLHKKYFPEMLQRMPLLGERLVALMSDRIRETTRQETQRDKLMALGKLSAGLAHELNNPAAAAQRAAKSLKETMDNVRDASLRLLEHPLSQDKREAILQFERDVTASAAENRSSGSTTRDPLALSDLEAELTECLEEHHVPEPWKIAGPLAEANADLDKMDELRKVVGDEVVVDVLRRVAALLVVFSLIREIDNSTKRISDLVSAIKRYSYMDQAAMQEVNLREDLENTLKIFGHWLKKGITVTTRYAEDTPEICAYGSELNQVWTNLIDNAIDAMNGSGELRVRTWRELDCAAVEIGDNGPGVPEAIRPKIFDPFFTTKGVGEGTGLGLDTVSRIVQKHHGNIEVKSKPGDTRFIVRLPINQPKARPQQNISEEVAKEGA
ncbi:MAG TPA: ATP-binding protein [Candidatus Acidoferrum sp.]|jgi:signal transduction histidine kinase